MKLMAKKDGKEIKELKAAVEDLTNKWKRALADYQNLEKNVSEQKKQWFHWAGSELILKLLTVVENLEKTAAHLKDQGLILTVDQFKKILAEEGLEPIKIEPGKTKFDAHLMECIDVQKGEDNQVLKVLEKGYKLKDGLLKPARVVVGKQKIETKPTDEAKEQRLKGEYM